MEVGGLLGLLVLIADVYAILKIAGSSATTGLKAIWIVVVLIFPLIGVVVWFIFGPGNR